MNTKRAFSLLEVVVAMYIIVFTTVGTLSVVYYSVVRTENDIASYYAVNECNSLLECIKADGIVVRDADGNVVDENGAIVFGARGDEDDGRIYNIGGSPAYKDSLKFLYNINNIASYVSLNSMNINFLELVLEYDRDFELVKPGKGAYAISLKFINGVIAENENGGYSLSYTVYCDAYVVKSGKMLFEHDGSDITFEVAP